MFTTENLSGVKKHSDSCNILKKNKKVAYRCQLLRVVPRWVFRRWRQAGCLRHQSHCQQEKRSTEIKKKPYLPFSGSPGKISKTVYTDRSLTAKKMFIKKKSIKEK